MMARFEIETILGYTQQAAQAGVSQYGGWGQQQYSAGSGQYDMYGGQYAGYPQTGKLHKN